MTTMVVEIAPARTAPAARRAHPLGVWARLLALPLYAGAVWSREWLGWWCLVPVALVTAALAARPLIGAPASTRSWASRAVFGERVYARRRTAPIPAQFRGGAVTAAYGAIGAGVVLLAHGLATADPQSALGGLALSLAGQAWYLDRMVLLYESLKWTLATTWDY